MTLTVEVIAHGRSWPCRLMRHSACRTAYRSTGAVAYLAEAGSLGAVGWLRCPCSCHGELPIPPLALEAS